MRVFESGIGHKIETDMYSDFIGNANLFPMSKFDLFKSESPSESIILSWKALNYNGFYQIFYFYIGSLIIVITIQLIKKVRANSCIKKNII